MKNKLIKLFKIGVLLFGISLLLWNCEKEDTIIEQSTIQNELSQVFENNFNPKEFKETLRYEYTVDWSKPKRKFSKQLNLNFYEFPITFSSDFNPDVFNAIMKSKFHQKYKIVVTENKDGNYTFFIAKYFLNTQKSLDVDYQSLSINKNIGFDGTIHLYDKNAKMAFAKHITVQKELNDFYLKPNINEKLNLQQKWVKTNCKTQTINHYRAFYERIDYPDGSYTIRYLYTILEYTTEEEVCDSKWIPDTKPCEYALIDGKCPTKFDDIKPILLCEDGFQDDGFGNCVEITKLEEDLDKIDASELTGKDKCLNDKLTKNGNPFVKNILKKFQGVSEFDINIKSKDKVFPQGITTGDGLNGKTRHTPGSSLINIEISSKLSNMPALAAARTLIHEYIHADMYRKLYTKYATQGDLDFRKTYQEFEKGNFNATSQHESMAKLYVNSIRDALKSFHKNILTGDYNYLTNNGTNPLSDNFYEALAWQGLKDHDVKAYIDLPNAKKTELTNALNAHYHSTTKNCPN